MNRASALWVLVCGLIATLVASVVLAFITPSMAQPRKLGGASDAKQHVSCDDISSVYKTFDKLASTPEQSGMHNQLVWKWGVKTPNQIHTVLLALKQRKEDCSKGQGAVQPSSFIGWDQVVANPPAQLKRDELAGLSWTDVQKWGAVRLPGGGTVDARVILVFGHPKWSDAEARKQASLVSSSVSVAHVKTCKAVAGANRCMKDGTEVILAPPKALSGGTVTLVPGRGVYFGTQGPSVITYTTTD